MIKRFSLFVFMSFIYLGVNAQSTSFLKQYEQGIIKNNKVSSFVKSDFKDIEIYNEYTDIKTGITHKYFQQKYKGIPIFNAVGSIHIKNGEIAAQTNRMVGQLSNKVVKSNHVAEPVHAIYAVANNLNLNSVTISASHSRNAAGAYEFKDVSFVSSPVIVTTKYFLTKENTLKQVYEVVTDMKDNADIWNTLVDAETGEILNKTNGTIYCNFGKQNKISLQDVSVDHSQHSHSKTREGTGTYRVYPLPAESPLEGVHELVDDPSFIEASPLGWHDTDGNVGAEYEITRGNNVHVYLDKSNTNSSSGHEPEGGSQLVFDYSHSVNADPVTNDDAAQVNLFYMNNMMHDLTYLLGFTEEAGNFQLNTYGNGGQGGDAVNAEASDGSGEDNANFATGSDGSYGRMQMFLWNNSGGLLSIDSPQEIEGLLTEVGTAAFGPPMSSVNITGKVVIADDGTSLPTTLCSNMLSTVESEGNIVLVDRGGCLFIEKVRRAEAAGAVAVVICNIPGTLAGGEGDGNGLINMGAADGVDPVFIPSLMVQKSTCDQIKASITNNIDVIMTFEEKELVGPTKFDASFDNGVVGHEYGHGISNRLVGGPSNTVCLGNEEQMGEGWSDFWTVVFTTKVGDTGDQPSSIGNYVDGKNINGRGIRAFPYSTDMTINPHTYDDIKATGRDANGRIIPHPIGTVWNTMLIDMYWGFIDLYGFDPDWTNTESGNFKAANLVIEGMKITSCSPGFVDGRDAIITADLLMNDGAHNCMIWEVFARRGLGFYAQQGNTNVVTDGTENFDPLPTCIQTLKIEKEITSIINEDDEVEVEIEITNHIPELQTGVTITETIPNGLEYVAGSSSVDVTEEDDKLIFTIGNLEYEDDLDITFKLRPNGASKTISLIYDGVEDDSDKWSNIYTSGFDAFFSEDDIDAHDGEFAWFISDEIIETDQSIQYGPITITGENPSLKFWHKYITESSIDGGFLQISTDEGSSWNTVQKEKFIRNGYNSPIGYGTFAIPALDGFSGNSNGYIDTYLDLSEYKDQSITIRFRFGTNEADSAGNPNSGWYIDDFEILDLVKFSTTTCVDSDQSGGICTDEFITIMNTDEHANSVNNIENIKGFSLYPNPAHDNTNLKFESTEASPASIIIYNMNGQVITEKSTDIILGSNNINVSLKGLSTGQYLLVIENNKGRISKKLTIVD